MNTNVSNELEVSVIRGGCSVQWKGLRQKVRDLLLRWQSLICVESR